MTIHDVLPYVIGSAVFELRDGAEDLDSAPLRGGTVVDVSYDPDDEPMYAVVDAFHGRTRRINLAHQTLDHGLCQREPNKATMRSHARRMMKEASTAKGRPDSWQLWLSATAMTLLARSE